MTEPAIGAGRKVARGIMRGLELGRFVPGQRLVETELAERFGVGRNAVREAIQWLSAQGVIDPLRNRSPMIRELSPEDARELLGIAALLIGQAARTAAERGASLADALAELEAAAASGAPGVFAQARRHFYIMLLTASGQRELLRLFPALGLHILHAQYGGGEAQQLAAIRAIAEAVAAGNRAGAEMAVRVYFKAVDEAVS